MKLNATVELLPLSEPGFNNIHPFVPPVQVPGYHEILQELEYDLCQLTGYDKISFQPNRYTYVMYLINYISNRCFINF